MKKNYLQSAISSLLYMNDTPSIISLFVPITYTDDDTVLSNNNNTFANVINNELIPLK